MLLSQFGVYIITNLTFTFRHRPFFHSELSLILQKAEFYTSDIVGENTILDLFFCYSLTPNMTLKS